MPAQLTRLHLERLDERIVPVTQVLATGAGPGGGPHVKVFNMDGSLRFQFFAYPANFAGGVRVATGDVTGDGFEDVVVGPGPGASPVVNTYDGRTGRLLSSFFVFDANYGGGVYVGTADVNGDGAKEIIASGAPGANPVAEIRVFRLNGFQYPGFIGRFFPYPGISGPAVFGGCTVAGMNYNFSFDNFEDIVVGAPSLSVYGNRQGQAVKIFNGTTATQLIGVNAVATGALPTGRINVSTGDVTGDGRKEVVYSVSNSLGSSIQVLGAVGLPLLLSYNPYPGFLGESTVTVKDINNDGVGDIVSGAGLTGQPLVIARRASNLSILLAFNAFQPNFFGGVFVG